MALVISGDSPSFSGTYQGGVITSGTAQASTSGTSIDFTGIPSWVKRITVLFNGVSTTGTSVIQMQLITGSAVTTGYNSCLSNTASGGVFATGSTSGFPVISPGAASDIASGSATISLLSGNTWSYQSVTSAAAVNRNNSAGGGIVLGAALTGVRITTVNGTDTFDAGSINILYE